MVVLKSFFNCFDSFCCIWNYFAHSKNKIWTLEQVKRMVKNITCKIVFQWQEITDWCTLKEMKLKNSVKSNSAEIFFRKMGKNADIRSLINSFLLIRAKSQKRKSPRIFAKAFPQKNKHIIISLLEYTAPPFSPK